VVDDLVLVGVLSWVVIVWISTKKIPNSKTWKSSVKNKITACTTA
jgi:hypothetical protein